MYLRNQKKILVISATFIFILTLPLPNLVNLTVHNHYASNVNNSSTVEIDNSWTMGNNVKDYKPISKIRISSISRENISLFNISINWKYGPGNRTLVIDSYESMIAIGTNLGFLVYYVNGTKIIGTYLGTSVTAIKLIDLEGDKNLEIISGTINGSFYCFDLFGNTLFSASINSRVLLVNYTSVFSTVERDFVVVSERDFRIYSRNGSLITLQSIEGGVSSCIISDIDLDDVYEIIIGSSTGILYIYDQGSLLTNVVNGAVSSLYSYDINKDGEKEILSGSDAGALYIFAHDASLIAKKAVSDQSIISIVAGDMDNDALPDIAVIDYSGTLRILNNSLYLKWQYNFSSKILSLLKGQLNIDPACEVIVINRTRIFGLDFNSTSNRWEIVWIRNSKFIIISSDIYDINSDNLTEIIYGGASYYVVLIKNDSSVIGQIIYTITSHIVSSDDLDDDGLVDIIVVDYSGNLFYLNNTYSIVWNYNLGANVSEVLLGDINSDGFKEIILKLKNNTLSVLEYNGSFLFSYFLAPRINDLTLADPDNDNSLEIVIGTENGVYIVNSSGITENLLYSGVNITALSAGDVFGFRHDTLVLGLFNGSIIIYDLPTTTTKKFDFNAGYITDVLVGRFGNADSENIVISTANGLIAMLNTSKTLWEITNSIMVVSVMNLIENSEIVANYRLGYIGISYNGVIKLNKTLANIISHITNGDLIGYNVNDIIILDNVGLMHLFDPNGSLIQLFNLSISSPSGLYCFDVDRNLVEDVLIATVNGLILLSTPAKFRIISPSNNSYLNLSQIELKWFYQGFSPLVFEVYLNSNLIDSLDLSYRSIIIDVPSDGAWIVTIRAIPRVGQLLSSSLNIIVDTHSPVISILSPENNSYFNNDSIRIVWDGYDNFSGINHYEIKLDDGDWINVYGNTSYSFENLSYGKHQIYIKAIDNSGNYNQSFIEIHIDYVSPIVIIEQPVNNSYINDSKLNISWRFIEDNLDEFELFIDSELAYTGRNTSYIVNGLIDGRHTITLICRDLAKNQNYTKIYITIDTKAPSLQVLSPRNYTYINRDVIDIQLRYNDTNMDRIIVSINDTSPIDFGLNQSVVIKIYSEGYYTVRILAYDKASNLNQTIIILIVDLSDPIINITYPYNNTYLNKSDIIVKWVGIDDASGIKYYEIRVDQGAIINVNTSTSFELSGLPDGWHKIEIRSYDKAGNMKCLALWINIDTVPPTIKVIRPANNTITNSSDIFIQIDYNETNLGNISLFINNSLFGTINNTAVIKIYEDGYYVILIKAVDLAGNRALLKLVLLVDRIQPILILPEKLNNTILANETIMIWWESYDNLSGVACFYISIDNGSYINLGLRKYFLIELMELSEGRHIVRIKATDLAGNAIVKSLYFYVERGEIAQEGFPFNAVVFSSVIITLLATLDFYLLYLRKKIRRNQ